MVMLSDLDKSRVYFHAGMGVKAGIDFGDLAQVEEACNTIPDTYIQNRILEQLDICDEAYEASSLTRSGVRYTTKELYLGDLNRTITRDSAKDDRIWAENYINECNKLCKILWIPCYQNQGMDRFRYERSAQAFMNCVPGVADTSVSSRRLEFTQLGGSFGY